MIEVFQEGCLMGKLLFGLVGLCVSASVLTAAEPTIVAELKGPEGTLVKLVPNQIRPVVVAVQFPDGTKVRLVAGAGLEWSWNGEKKILLLRTQPKLGVPDSASFGADNGRPRPEAVEISIDEENRTGITFTPDEKPIPFKIGPAKRKPTGDKKDE